MKGLCLIIWMLLTLVLVCSLVGLTILVPDNYENADNVPSTWMKIGIKLLNSVTQ